MLLHSFVLLTIALIKHCEESADEEQTTQRSFAMPMYQEELKNAKLNTC